MSTMLTPFTAVDSLFGGMSRRFGSEGEALLRPRVNMYENDSEYWIDAELPGVSKDDLSLEIERGLLTVSAERKLDEENQDKAIHVERHGHLRYRRSFRLGDTVDTDNIKATFNDGILRLTLPKGEKALPRKISVD